MINRAVILHPKDNVATALVDLSEGERLELHLEDHPVLLTVQEAVPFGHKVSLVLIPARAEIIKYGESIGVARADIPAGFCVHVENVESRRGRGDLGKPMETI